MSLAINPGFDKSTRHGYQDCNVPGIVRMIHNASLHKIGQWITGI